MQPLDEVNFWRPSSTTSFRVLKMGEPLLFKLKKAHGDAIVGFGFFVGFQVMSVREAWAMFGTRNGVHSLDALRQRVEKYVKRSASEFAALAHPIGCILLTSPVFFPPSHWVEGPRDWRPQIVSGKSYDLTKGEGARIWSECYKNAMNLSLTPDAQINAERGERARRGKPVLVQPRLGQGTFRVAVRQAYEQCAVTGEHALPALDAAHIRPFVDNGPHEVPNGLLLRADIHRLFDGGYVTVTPEMTFEVSGALNERFNNGKVYYEMQGRKIMLPRDTALHPRREHLEHHRDEIFLGR